MSADNRPERNNGSTKAAPVTSQPSSSNDYEAYTAAQARLNRPVLRTQLTAHALVYTQEPVMFYACVAIVVMVCIMVGCLVISIIDLHRYNFGLYLVLLCIVGIMLACALCVANPTMCSNPKWYVRMCALLGDAHNARAGHAVPFTGNNIGDIWRNAQQQARNGEQGDDAEDREPGRIAAVMMAPGMHVMSGIWKAMAWVAEEIEPDEDDEEDSEETSSIAPKTKTTAVVKATTTTRIEVEQEQELPLLHRNVTVRCDDNDEENKKKTAKTSLVEKGAKSLKTAKISLQHKYTAVEIPDYQTMRATVSTTDDGAETTGVEEMTESSDYAQLQEDGDNINMTVLQRSLIISNTSISTTHDGSNCAARSPTVHLIEKGGTVESFTRQSSDGSDEFSVHVV